MGHLRMTRTILTSSVFITLVAMGLPLAPNLALTGPAAASTDRTSQSTPTPATGCAALPPGTGEHCLPLSAQVTGTVVTASGRCSALVVLQVQLVKSVVQYSATWTPPNQTTAYPFSASGGPDDVTASGVGAWSTEEIAYGGLIYKVPAGDGAWMLGAGGGAAPCTSPGPGTVQAWGWTAQPVVRGHVTFQGNAGPAAGIKVKAACASGGTTTTGSKGAYGFVLDRGACTIAPILAGGETSDPHQRVVSVADQDITNVDFVVPGGPLKVSVKKLEPLRSGLAIHGVHYSQSQADFTASSGSGAEARFTCESGCADITVDVVDPATGKAPAPYATVDVSVDPLQPGTETFNGQTTTATFGDATLCTTSATGQDKECSVSLHGLQTNADGQVHLRYWAPGVLANANTTLTVTAHCDARPCSAGQTTSYLALTVKPYVIYQHSQALTNEDALEMREWASGGTTFTQYLEGSTLGFDVITNALKLLKKFEIATKTATEVLEGVENIEPWAELLDYGLKINKYFEAEGMLALFLDLSGLSPFGIGAPPSEASASGAPTTIFTNELVNQILAPNFLKMGDGGFWWASAQDIYRVINAYGAGLESGWSLNTKVYEVSHCDNAEGGECGPGYRNNVGNSATIRSGVQPELVFELTLLHDKIPGEALAFSIQYDALAWATTQPCLKGVIQDSGAGASCPK
jgi:hypothetical protein